MQHIRQTRNAFISALSALTLLGPAHAATATGTLNVDAVVLNTCAVATTPVTFTNVGLTQATGNGTVTVTCTNTSAFTVALDGGSNADISARTLTSILDPSDTFTYQLYTASDLSTVWGDGSTGSTVAGTGPLEILTVYGATTSSPAAPGVFADTVTVTVTY